jgi:hypothetical protein
MIPSWLVRFGAVCGALCGLLIGVPGAIEAFTGETTATSFALGLGPGLAMPLLTAVYLRQSSEVGRFGAVAYAVNLIGLGLFGGVAFALNMVVFYLDESVVATLLAGPTKVAFLGSAVVFVVGTALFGISLVRGGVFPRLAGWGYGVSLTALALLAPLPDTPLVSAVHALAGATLVWLSLQVWSQTALTNAESPASVTLAEFSAGSAARM